MSQYFDLTLYDEPEPDAVSGDWSIVAELDAIEARATAMLHMLAQPPGSFASRARKPGKGCGASKVLEGLDKIPEFLDCGEGDIGAIVLSPEVTPEVDKVRAAPATADLPRPPEDRLSSSPLTAQSVSAIAEVSGTEDPLPAVEAPATVYHCAASWEADAPLHVWGPADAVTEYAQRCAIEESEAASGAGQALPPPAH